MFHATANVDVLYGRYIWCGNLDSPTSSGFKLTNQSHGDSYGPVNRYMMSLTIVMDVSLFHKTTHIEVRDHTGFLRHYSWKEFTHQRYTHTTVLKPELIGTELQIQFVIPQVLTDEEKIALRGRRHPVNVIHEITVMIPNMQRYDKDESDDCNICYQPLLLDEKHVTPCGHAYHTNCIWNYLQPQQDVIHSQCAKQYANGKPSCCNTTHVVGSYRCPVCANIVET